MEIPENSYSSLNDLIRHRKTDLKFEISFSSFYYNNQKVELADRAYTQYQNLNCSAFILEYSLTKSL